MATHASTQAGGALAPQRAAGVWRWGSIADDDLAGGRVHSLPSHLHAAAPPLAPACNALSFRVSTWPHDAPARLLRVPTGSARRRASSADASITLSGGCETDFWRRKRVFY